MPSTQERKVKPLEGVVYLRKSGNIHGAMELVSWIFLRRKKFCSKAWFKEEHKIANFPRAQGTFYLTSSSPLRRDITWSLQGAPDPQLLSLGLWLVSDVQWTQSCYWALYSLAQRVLAHPDAEKLPATDWSILIDKEHNIPNF